MKENELIKGFMVQLLEDHNNEISKIIEEISFGSANLNSFVHECSWIESEIFEGRVLYSITDFKFYYLGWAQEFGGNNITCFDFEGDLLPKWLQDSLKNESLWRTSKN